MGAYNRLVAVYIIGRKSPNAAERIDVVSGGEKPAFYGRQSAFRNPFFAV